MEEVLPLELLTLAEAAAWLSRRREFPLSENGVFDLIKQEKLPICFEHSCDWIQVSIRHPEGTTEAVELPVQFEGVLKSLVPPRHRESLRASFVRILRADGMHFSKAGGKLIKGHRLPTEHSGGGYIRPGYEVDGWIDFVDVPASEWLFHIHDLKRLLEAGEQSAATQHQAPAARETRGDASPKRLVRVEPPGGDALTPLVWIACYDIHEEGKKQTPRLVRTRLIQMIGVRGCPIIGHTADGIKFESAGGDQIEVSNDALRKRISEWRKACLTGETGD